MASITDSLSAAAIPALGIAVGLAIAFVAVLSWRIPASSQSLGAEVRFIAALAGEVSVSPAGPLLTARRLGPGDSAGGRFELRNLTGRALRVRLRALPSAPALDRTLRVQFTADGRLVAGGRLGGLRSFAAGAGLTLPAAASREVEVHAQLSPTAGRGAEGQIVDVALELQARRAGAGR